MENSRYGMSGICVVVFSNQPAVKHSKDSDLMAKRYLVLNSDDLRAGTLTVAGGYSRAVESGRLLSGSGGISAEVHNYQRLSTGSL